MNDEGLKVGIVSVCEPLTAAESLLLVVRKLVDSERRMRAIEQEKAEAVVEYRYMIKRVEFLAEQALGRSVMLGVSSVEASDSKGTTTQEDIEQVVNGTLLANGYGAASFAHAWSRLYRKFKDRHGLDLVRQARDYSKQTGIKTRGIDVAEASGRLGDLHAVARELYGSVEVGEP